MAPVELLVLGHDLGGEGQLVHEVRSGRSPNRSTSAASNASFARACDASSIKRSRETLAGSTSNGFSS